MQPRLRRALDLSWNDWAIVLQAWVWLLAVDLGLRVLSFGRLKRLLGVGGRTRPPADGDQAAGTIRELGRLVRIAGRYHLVPARCLQMSLVLQWLLARRGIVTEMRIGVRKAEDGLSAHAWLEHNGQPIDEPERIETRFSPLVAHSVD
jgi:hypothetical protein